MALKGFAHKMGLDIASTWGTAVEVAAGDGIPFLSEGLTPDITLVDNNRLTGTPFQGEGTKGTERYQGPISVDVDAETIHRMLAVLMGHATNSQQGGEEAYEHTLYMNESLEGVMATIVFGQESEFVREFTTAKFDSVEFTCSPDSNLQATFQAAAQGRNDNEGAGTNTLTTWGTITDPSNSNIFTWNDLVVRINDQSAGALASGDQIYISELSLSINNQLKLDRFTTQYAPLISEPKRNGFVLVEGSITLDEIDTTTALALMSDAQDKTVKKMDWVFTGGSASASYDYTMTFEFAGLQFLPIDDAVDGPEIPDLTLPFRAVLASSNPTGFDHSDACRIKVLNTNGADPLTAT